MEKTGFPRYIFLVIGTTDEHHFFQTKEAAVNFAQEKGVDHYFYLLNGSDFASKVMVTLEQEVHSI